MNLAVCEDDSSDMERLRRIFDGRLGYRPAYFTTGGQFLQKVKEGVQFDIILMDIKLPDKLGTEVAALLKEYLPGSDVVFISSYPEYVTDAFSLHATQFFMKPVREDMLLQEINSVAARRKSENDSWCVSNRRTIYRLSTQDVIFVESYYRHLRIQLFDHNIEVTGKLSDACQKLNPNIFRLCHQGFLVNMNHVIRIEQKEIICTNNYHVPISYRRRREFIQAYTEFMAN